MEKNKYLRICILIIILVLTMFSISAANWWDNNYEYRQVINVTTGSNSPYNGYENYTVQFSINTTENKFLNNGNDLRIVYWNGITNQELDREIIDINNVSTRIRFKLQNNIASSTTVNNYYLYYNYSSATSPPQDLSNVYLWYDNASTNRESEYIQGKIDGSAHGNQWRNSINWNPAGYYTYDTGDNFVDSMRPNSLIERDIYFEYEAYQIDAFPNDMTTGPLCRWQGSGSGSSENSNHFYYYEMAESTILGGSYSSHDDITANNRASTVINYGLLPLFPANAWTRLGISAWGTNPTNIKAYYNNESGGWNGYRFSGTHASGVDNEGAGQFGPWLQQEEGRLKNLIARRYIEPEPSLIAFNNTKYSSDLSYILTNASSSLNHYVLENGVLNVSVEVSCSQSFMGTCGNVTGTIQYNNSVSTFTSISTIDSTPVWTNQINPQSCILSSGNTCFFSWLVNATGVVGSFNDLNIDINSNYSQVQNIVTDNITLRIINTGIVAFNQSEFSFQNFDKNSGDKSKIFSIKSNFGANNNIEVNCESGDCSFITDNWADGINLAEGISQDITFTCQDLSSGNYSAIFNVTSLGNPFKDTIKINCNINEIFGPINVQLEKPSSNVTTAVMQNRTLELNASVNCVGLCGEITAYPIVGRAKTGLSSSDPADSGWQIKEYYPHFQSGIYWIQTPAMSSPEQIYVDMDYDGGGWMLVGRGRDGWNWNDAGRGTFADVSSIPTGIAAFSPDYYSSSFINELLNNTNVNSLFDGVRLRRAADTTGLAWQEVRWYFSTLNGWDWDFDSSFALSSHTVDGTNLGTDDTRDAGPNNDRRVFTWAWGSHNNQEGFSYGATVTAGTNTPNNYLWEYAVEGSSIPFTQVYVRPRIIDSNSNYLINTSNNLGLYSLVNNVQSCAPIEDGFCSFKWDVNVTESIGSLHNLSVIFFSNISSISLNQTQIGTINVSTFIEPQVTLISPANNLKLLTSENVTFSWQVIDDSSTLNCSLYINGVFNQTNTCLNSVNNNLSLNLERGIYNWSVQVNDSDSNVGISSTWNFTVIKNISRTVQKSIKFENINQYKIEILIKDLTDKGIFGTLIEWMLNGLNSGSQSPLSNWVNVTALGEYIGWENEEKINHSIAGVGNYSVRNAYIIGVD